MPERFRIQIIFVIEYDVNSYCYPETNTPEERLKLDISGAKNNPLEFIESFHTRRLGNKHALEEILPASPASDDIKIEVKGEVL